MPSSGVVRRDMFSETLNEDVLLKRNARPEGQEWRMQNVKGTLIETRSKSNRLLK